MLKTIILASSLLATFAQAEKPDLFLLKTYQPDKSVIGWLMSEKLDGVRAYWDGKSLVSRNGNTFHSPAWFTQDFPPFPLDGELWTKRNDFSTIVSIVTTEKGQHKEWGNIKLHIFEVPKQKGGLLDRLQVLTEFLKEAPNQFIQIIPQIKIKSSKQLKQFVEKITQNKGEGAVVRNPNTPYQTGRLSSALKIKNFQDSECIVKQIILGKNKYSDKMGAIACQLNSGTVIKIGTGFSDREREQPPKIGQQITFKYYGLTKNKLPRFPVFLRVRRKK